MNQLNSFSCYIIGKDSLVIQCAEILLKENFQILGITSDDPLIIQWCSVHDIPILESFESLLTKKERFSFDYLFSIMNSKILSHKMVTLPHRGAINFHDSPLPKYAGLLATTWAILNNEKTHGISWHIMDEIIDRGDILKQSFFHIDKNETTLSLNLKCYEHAVQAFQELIIELKENRVIRKKQNLSNRSYYGSKHKPPNDGFISWRQSADKISLLCRALTFGNYFNPLGNAKFIIKNQVLAIKNHQVLSVKSNKLPGTIISINKDSLHIATKTNDIALLMVAYDNSDEICSITDLVTELKIQVGDQLQSMNRRHLVKRIDYKKNTEHFFIMTPADKKKIIYEWNRTKTKYFHKKTVCKIFEEQVVKSPYAIVAIFENKSITYEELNHQSNKLAYSLLEQGVKSEAIVGIFVERSIDMLIVILGILKAGAAYLPLDPTYPEERLYYMLKDSKTSLVIINKISLKNKLQNFSGKFLYFQSSSRINLKDKKNPKNSPNPDHLAYVIYTSGTTGKPKGVEVTHRSLHNHMMWMKKQFGFNEEDVFFQKTPFSFDASVWEFFIPSYVGGKLVIAPPQAHMIPQKLIELVIKHKITTLQLVPTMLKELLNTEKFKECHSLKRVFSGGETLFPNIIWEFFKKMSINLYNLYGPTEATIDTTSLECMTSHGQISSCLIGKPIANTKIYVLDKKMKIMPIGVPGELYIGGQCLARGYLNQPELTKEKFLPNPFDKNSNSKLYKTGDLVQWQSDGNLEYLGRCDDQVKIRGCRVEINEVEAHLLNFPLIQQCVVAIQKDSRESQALAAYILPKKNAKILPQDLHHFLGQSLPLYMIPSYFYTVDQFITTPSGKIDRNNFLISTPLPLTMEKKYSPPITPEEKVLVEIFKCVLNENPIGIDDNFFDLGGNSLNALRISTLIEKKLSLKLNIGKLFEFPTITELAKEISIKEKNHIKMICEIKKSSLIKLHKGAENSPLFLIHPIGGSIFWYKYLAKYIDKNRPLYAIQDPGIETREFLFKTLEEMAAFYVDIIKIVQPHGTYLLGGASFGATVAIEMARQLLKRNERVNFIALLDGWSSYHALASDKNYFETLMREQNQAIFNQNVINDDIDSNFILELQWHREKLLANYQMPCLNQKFTLFKAKELWHIFKKDAPFNGWENYSTFPIERYIIPGNHETIFYEPYVQLLAKNLNSCLESLSLINLLYN